MSAATAEMLPCGSRVCSVTGLEHWPEVADWGEVAKTMRSGGAGLTVSTWVAVTRAGADEVSVSVIDGQGGSAHASIRRGGGRSCGPGRPGPDRAFWGSSWTASTR